jgi:formamidopyrimidine-DNA glycosylase
MPELPEVESSRRLLEKVLKGARLERVEAADDPLVLSGHSAAEMESKLTGAKVVGAGRKGKYFWLELDPRPWLCGHFGMSGWLHHLGGKESRLLEHGKAPLLDPEGRPKFLKLLLEASNGEKVAFTDGRRLGRIWLCDDAEQDPRIAKLGPDAWLEMPDARAFSNLLQARKTPLKAALMDQAMISGVGNWVADEALYHARLAPARPASSLKPAEANRLRKAILDILDRSIEVGADFSRFPEDWLFHHRWGGKRGKQEIGGKKIRRDTVGGRTTAWVPDLQK